LDFAAIFCLVSALLTPSGIGKNRQRSLAAFGAFTFDHVAKLPSMLLRQKFGIWD
jgi:hypothetical protein